MLASLDEVSMQNTYQAAKAALKGSEATRQMRAVWGRAAYYGDSSIGLLDGGSYVGALIFKALEQTSKEG